MFIQDFIIFVYLLIEEYLAIVVTHLLRRRGFAPALSDVEIITLQIIREFLGMDSDKSIWMYFKNN